MYLLCMTLLINAADKTMTVKDLKSRNVTISVPVKKTVCIGPGALRLIVYLQCADKVAGIENIELKYPAGRPYRFALKKLDSLKIIGPGSVISMNSLPNLEAILEIKPDLIIASYMKPGIADKINKITKIPVVIISYGPFGSFDETLKHSLKLLGKIFHKEKRAADLINFINRKHKDLLRRADNSKYNKVCTAYIGGIGFKGEAGINSTDTDFIPFQWTNVTNAVKQSDTKGHLNIGKEKLLSLNPDYIFITGGSSKLIKENIIRNKNIYSVLKAFKNKNVYSLYPFNWYVTNIGTAILDAYCVGKILYPDTFKDIDLEDEANYIYSFLIGSPIYKQMKKVYGTIGGRVKL